MIKYQVSTRQNDSNLRSDGSLRALIAEELQGQRQKKLDDPKGLSSLW